MIGLCLLTLTILSQIIPGSYCDMSSSIQERSRNVQYSDDNYSRSHTSDSSSNEALGSTRDMLKKIFRDVNTIINSFSPSLHEPSRRKYKRSPEDRASRQMDSRMLKQVWDAYNRHKNEQHQVAEDRYFLFPSFDSWADSFSMYFFRDMAFNVFKVVGLSALYYLAPGVLTWYTQTFGSN